MADETQKTGQVRPPRSTAGEALRPGPLFVLCDPQMGENIGSVARAMLNFGLAGLRIVNPRDGWPNPKAAATASGAAIVIDQARVFDDLGAALEDCTFVLATTARRRELSLPVLDLKAAAAALGGRIDRGERCAVLFGGERNGLSSDDVARADAILSIPVNPAFASLNLAQAAMLVAYEWSEYRAAHAPTASGPISEEGPADREEVERLVHHLFQELDARNYFFPPEMREIMQRNLRVALTRAGFTSGEVRSLRGVIKSLTRRPE